MVVAAVVVAGGAKPGGATKVMTPNTKARKIAKGRKRFDEMRAAREAASSDAPAMASTSVCRNAEASSRSTEAFASTAPA